MEEETYSSADESTIGTSAADDRFTAIREAYEAGDELTDDQLDAIADVAIAIVRSILTCFGETNSTIDEYEGDEGELILDINGGDLAVLIGRHGRVLDSFQLLVSSLVSSKLGFHYPVVVDIEGYKNRRRQKLQTLAVSSAARAKRQHSQVRLKPMNAYERHIIHTTLQEYESVTTYSTGTEPNRRVVVAFDRQKKSGGDDHGYTSREWA